MNNRLIDHVAQKHTPDITTFLYFSGSILLKQFFWVGMDLACTSCFLDTSVNCL